MHCSFKQFLEKLSSVAKTSFWKGIEKAITEIIVAFIKTILNF